MTRLPQKVWLQFKKNIKLRLNFNKPITQNTNLFFKQIKTRLQEII